MVTLAVELWTHCFKTWKQSQTNLNYDSLAVKINLRLGSRPKMA